MRNSLTCTPYFERNLDGIRSICLYSIPQLSGLKDRRVIKDPDLIVQWALDPVFSQFAALNSCKNVLRSYRDEDTGAAALA